MEGERKKRLEPTSAERINIERMKRLLPVCTRDCGFFQQKHVNPLKTLRPPEKRNSPLGPVERVTVSPSAGGGGVGPGFNGCSCVIHCQALFGATGKFQFTSSSAGAGLGWKSRSNHEARPCTREVRETMKSMGMVNSKRSSLEQV